MAEAEKTDVRAEDEAPPTERAPDEAKPSKKRSFLRQLAELPFLVIVAFLIAIVIKTFIVQAFFIPSESMFPALRIGDRVLVEKISYRLHDPRRSDVIVFAKDILGEQPDVPWPQDVRNFLRELVGLPTGNEEDFIKRIVAIEGDTIRYAGTPRRLVVNGDDVSQSFVARGTDRSSPTLTDKDCKRLGMGVSDNSCVVPARSVFVMGDNRDNSQDSRFFGPIAEDKIIGRAFVIIWPLDDFGSL